MNQTQTGAAIGGALGTAAGLGIGAATGNPRTGALIGGLAGAGVGGLIGNEADKEERRQQAAIEQATAAAAATPQKLGLTDIVHLTHQGHDEQVIINQIRATGSTFQLTTSDLDWLKANGVSPRVIAEMQSRPPAMVSMTPRATGGSTTTIIYDSGWSPWWVAPPIVATPVVVRPVYVPPPRPPVVFVGGYYRCR
jgi:surface antigen